MERKNTSCKLCKKGISKGRLFCNNCLTHENREKNFDERLKIVRRLHT